MGKQQGVKQYLDCSNKLQGDAPGFDYELIHLEVSLSLANALLF